MNPLDPTKQYTNSDYGKLGLNAGDLWNGNQINYGGGQYKVVDNGNGTRSFNPMGGNSSNSSNSSGNSNGSYTFNPSGALSDYNNWQQQYGNTVKNQESVSGMADRLGNQYGLPGLQQSALDLTNTLKNMPTTQQNATRGFDVNQAQLDKIISDQTQKLAPTVQNVVSAAQNAQGLVNQGLGYGLQEEQRQIQPLVDQGQFLANRYATEATGYGQQQRNQLDQLLQQMNQGSQLNLEQMREAASLAQLENSQTFQAQQNAASRSNQMALANLQFAPYNASDEAQKAAAQLNKNKSTSQVPPSYFKKAPTASATLKFGTQQQPSNQGILSQLGNWFNSLKIPFTG